jgi:hypothetical protein
MAARRLQVRKDPPAGLNSHLNLTLCPASPEPTQIHLPWATLCQSRP